jgi:hypothetical protein
MKKGMEKSPIPSRYGKEVTDLPIEGKEERGEGRGDHSRTERSPFHKEEKKRRG